MSEPAILVKRRGKGSQIWSMDKFENKIIDMREMYEERKEKGLPMMVEEPDDDPVAINLVCLCMAVVSLVLWLPHQLSTYGSKNIFEGDQRARRSIMRIGNVDIE